MTVTERIKAQRLAERVASDHVVREAFDLVGVMEYTFETMHLFDRVADLDDLRRHGVDE